MGSAPLEGQGCSLTHRNTSWGLGEQCRGSGVCKPLPGQQGEAWTKALPKFSRQNPMIYNVPAHLCLYANGGFLNCIYFQT